MLIKVILFSFWPSHMYISILFDELDLHNYMYIHPPVTEKRQDDIQDLNDYCSTKWATVSIHCIMKGGSESEAFIQQLTLRLRLNSYLDNCLCYMFGTQNCFLGKNGNSIVEEDWYMTATLFEFHHHMSQCTCSRVPSMTNHHQLKY